MSISYNKLWKLLIDKSMNKTQLKKEAKISSNAIAKMGKNEAVSMEIITKVCGVLECDIGDVVEINKEESIIK
jgi:Predicted transcriptional regulator